MINAFKQIRLTNINVSGNNGRVQAGESGSFAYLSELNASGLGLYNLLTGVSGSVSQSNYDGLSALSGHLTTASGNLNSKIDTVSGNLNTYIDDRINGVIDLAPDALDTLNELAAALNDDASFASNITNFITTGTAAVQSSIDLVSGNLDSLSGTLTGNYVTLNTDQTIVANKEIHGNLGVSGVLTVVSGIDANNATISNVGSPSFDTDAVNLAYVTGVSGSLQSDVDTRVLSASQKQFSVLVPTGIESSGIVFPGNAFSSIPSVVVTFEGDVAYQTIIKNRTTSGFDVFFSDQIQEGSAYLNVFASNQ